VALSGGTDSLALVVLAAEWAKARGGNVTALTVDHRLRPASAAEARSVGNLMRRLGIGHRVLVWRGRKPASGVMAAARAARYRLLGDWCRRRGVLHLLAGHQRDDQAETVILRRRQGSGPDGLAGMAALAEREGHRLLRPLLEFSRAEIAGFLRRAGLVAIEDPTNRDPAYARSNLRREGGLDHARLAAAARRGGRARATMEAKVAALLARAATLHAEGWAEIELGAFRRVRSEVGQRALARLLTTVGGGEFPPRGARLARAFDRLEQGAARTLGGCRILPWRQGRIAICRELAACQPPVAPGKGAWDGRFRICAKSGRVGALGDEGWRQVRSRIAPVRIPHPARLALPALWRGGRVVAQPQLGFGRGLGAEFRPRRALSDAPFRI